MSTWNRGGALLALCISLSACGSINSTQAIRGADSALEAAEAQRAEERAVYEYTLAREYYEKARHEWAQSDWKQARRYGQLASEWAERAAERGRTGGPATGVEQ